MYFKLLFVLAVLNLVRFLYDFSKKNAGKKLAEIDRSSLIVLGITVMYSFMVCFVCVSPTAFFRTVTTYRYINPGAFNGFSICVGIGIGVFYKAFLAKVIKKSSQK